MNCEKETYGSICSILQKVQKNSPESISNAFALSSSFCNLTASALAFLSFLASASFSNLSSTNPPMGLNPPTDLTSSFPPVKKFHIPNKYPPTFFAVFSIKLEKLFSVDDFFDKSYLNHSTSYESGLLKEESALLLKSFFKERR